MKSTQRRILVVGFTAGLLFLMTRATPAQNPNSNANPAASVVQRAAAAHGGRWTSGEIGDSTVEGKLTLFTATGPKATFDVSLSTKGASRFQRVIKQSSKEVRQGTDGINTWESAAGFYTPAAQGKALQFIESQTTRSVSRLFNHQSEGLTLRDGGSQGKSRKIEAEDRQGKKTTYFVDSDTDVVTRVEFTAGQVKDSFSAASVPDTDTYVFTDYRTVQGVLTPFKIERYSGGEKTEEMQFSSVRYNAGLKDQDFKR